MCLFSEVTPDYLKCYLAAHPDVLDQYVTESLTEDKVEIWLRKIQMKTSESSPGIVYIIQCRTCITFHGKNA